jgi:enoyl-CoA hydratase/carnithine racemase
LLKQFSKPYMALMHGYTMGGGMGASVHGTYRVITDNSILAMPETSIGYFPDVGGSYFLNQCPGSIGLYLGLTGLHISGFDAVYAGWATHYVPSDLMDKMKLDLRAGKSFDDCLRNYSKNVPFSTLQHQRDEIDAHFNHDSLEDIFHSLENSSSHFAKAALSLLNHRSPISLHVSFRQLKISRNMNFANIMASEYKLSQKFVRESDFKEGIRAAIVTKDRAPKWKYASIYDVPPEEIDEYFLSSNKALSLDS